MTHLVAYGTPAAAGPNLAVLERQARERSKDKHGWPTSVVEMTDAGRTLCGGDAHADGGSVALFDYAFQTPRADICPGCIEAAERAGRPLPPEDKCE